jgi:hypothetical protein
VRSNKHSIFRVFKFSRRRLSASLEPSKFESIISMRFRKSGINKIILFDMSKEIRPYGRVKSIHSINSVNTMFFIVRHQNRSDL